MEKVELTLIRMAKVFWYVVWRLIIFSGLSGVVFGIVLGILKWMFDWSETTTTVMLYIGSAGIYFGWLFFLIGLAIENKYEDFQLVMIAVEDETTPADSKGKYSNDRL